MKRVVNNLVFPQRFKEILEENKETTYTIAEKLNLTAGTISRYANGKMSPKITTVEVICRMYDINPSWLMGYNVPKHDPDMNILEQLKNNPDTRMVAKIHGELTPQGQKDLLRYAELLRNQKDSGWND